jgi:hypothetical protein
VGLLAHALGSGADNVTSAFLAVDIGLFAWFMHVRRAPARGARWIRIGLPLVMVALLVAAVTASTWAPKPTPSGKVLSTSARLEFVTPSPGEVIHGSKLHVSLRLTGGRLAPITQTKVKPDEGHIHLFIDGRLVSMVNGLSQDLTGLAPGDHLVEAEFVQSNHRPWRSPVKTAVLVRAEP